ncbi:MAG: type II toxin-antitoxin system RelE/ParE family toxin [Gallionella sp.]|nr:type II toxin-antitoxin system RelE/ParE family toxin [Gallionella sp.]
MPHKHFRIKISRSAEKDRERVEQYASILETRNRRILALSNAVLSLKDTWPLCPYFDQDCGVRVCYVEGWYSVFFTVDEPARLIVVIAILGQAEDLNKVPI